MLLTESIELIEADRAPAISLSHAPRMVCMVAQEEPDLFSIVKPGVKLLVAGVAFVVVASDSLGD